MSDNKHDGERQLPFPLVEKGKGYSFALQSRAQAILNSLLGYLASNYEISSPSTEYAYYLKAIATELGKFTLTMEDLSNDISFETVRSEFIHQVLGYMVFVGKDLPEMDFNDEDFRNFLLSIITIYFQGSTPKSVEDAIKMFTTLNFKIHERFQDPSYDISHQFTFEIEFDQNNQFPQDVFRIQNNIELLVDIVKPAHTLYSISHRFSDIIQDPEDDTTLIKDSHNWGMHDFRYEDVRKYCQGMEGFSSQTGAVDPNDLNDLTRIYDTDHKKPLYSVAIGASLTIPSGPNRGIYTVTGKSTPEEVKNGVRYVTVHPRLKVYYPPKTVLTDPDPTNPFKYSVEVDRLGAKKEIEIKKEDVSNQFISTKRLAVSWEDLYDVTRKFVYGETLEQGQTIRISAQSNASPNINHTWTWTHNGVTLIPPDINDPHIVEFHAPIEPNLPPHNHPTYHEICLELKLDDGRSVVKSYVVKVPRSL